MLEVRQSGLDLLWKKEKPSKISRENACKNLKLNRRPSRLTFDTLKSTFVILALGLGLATIVFLAELCFHKVEKAAVRPKSPNTFDAIENLD